MGVLVDRLIPLVYETLGLAKDSAKYRIEASPYTADTVVTRHINNAYTKWAQDTRCFRRDVAVGMAAMTVNGRIVLPADVYDIQALRYGDLVLTITNANALDLRASEWTNRGGMWRTQVSGTPSGWYRYDTTQVGIYPRPYVTDGLWAAGVAYAGYQSVEDGSDWWQCVTAHTSSLANRPSTMTAWATGQSYPVDTIKANPDGDIYRCILLHTSNTSRDCPGYGALWATYWEKQWTRLSLRLDTYVTPPSTGIPLLSVTDQTPMFPARWHDALAYGAAATVGGLMLADLPDLQQRVMAADGLFRQYASECVGYLVAP